MILINLLYTRRPDGRRSPPIDSEGWVPLVRLWRSIGGVRTRAPLLHLVGYRVTPDRAAPLCGPFSPSRYGVGGGPYGAIEWHRHLHPRDRACTECARHATGDQRVILQALARTSGGLEP